MVEVDLEDLVEDQSVHKVVNPAPGLVLRHASMLIESFQGRERCQHPQRREEVVAALAIETWSTAAQVPSPGAFISGSDAAQG